MKIKSLCRVGVLAAASVLGSTAIAQPVSMTLYDDFNGRWDGGTARAETKTVCRNRPDQTHRYIICQAEATVRITEEMRDSAAESETNSDRGDVDGYWFQGNYCYTGDGKRYTRLNGRWYSWKQDRFAADPSGDKVFRGRKLKQHTGAIPPDQLRIARERAQRIAHERRSKILRARARRTAAINARKLVQVSGHQESVGLRQDNPGHCREIGVAIRPGALFSCIAAAPE